jgi:hypothetical protein
MTLQQKQVFFTANVALLIDHILENKYSVTFGEAFRTPEQAEIYAKSGKGIKDSLHCKRLAIDLNLFDSNGKYLTNKKDYEQFGAYWKSLNPANRWGGDFPKLVDCVHFEMQDL